MKFFYSAYILIITFFLASCTITQEFYFNKDFSGTYSSAIDMSQLIDMTNSLDTAGTANQFKDSLKLILKQAVLNLQYVGVSDLKSGWKNNKTLFISYDFPNINVLNKALNKSGMNENNSADKEDYIYFTRKGKNLIYHGISANKVSAQSKDLKAMKDYYKYKAIFNFERKIKKIDNPNYLLSDDKHRAVMEAALFDITKQAFDSKVKFKLK